MSAPTYAERLDEVNDLHECLCRIEVCAAAAMDCVFDSPDSGLAITAIGMIQDEIKIARKVPK